MSAVLAWLRAGLGFLAEWRASIIFAYRKRYGMMAAVPVVWGCADAYMLPWLAPLGFLATGLFLEGARIGKRLALQAFFFTVWSAYLTAVMPAPQVTDELEAPFYVTGRVEGFPSHKAKCTFTIATGEGSFRVIADPPGFPIEPGQRLRARVRADPPAPPTNPGQFDYASYLRSQGIRGVLRADSLTMEARPGAFDRLVTRLRRALESALSRSVPPAQAPMLHAGLLGISEELDPALVDDFKASGMLHILAISGQHIGIFALILLQIFSLLRLPRKAAFMATGLLLGIYAPICGGQISVIRAAIMFWCCLPSVLWERPGQGINNLGWAAAACLIWMPAQILSLGFQLSFAATFLLIHYSRPMASLLERMGIRSAASAYLVSNPVLSLVIYLGLYPLLAASVHMVAPSSILGNLATVGLCSGMIVSACLTLLFQPIGILASCFGEAAGAMAALLALAVHGLARFPGSSLSAASLSPVWSMLLLFLVCAFPFAARRGRGLALILLGIAAFCGRWAGTEAMDALRAPASVAFLDVGQGDGAVCRLPGAVILVDAGPPDAGRKVILPYLRSQGIDRLDLVVVTHPDLDHYGGLAYLAEHIRIGTVAHPGEEADTRAWKGLREALERRGIPMVTVRSGQKLYSGPGMSMTVLSPDHPGQFPERNDNSVVAMLELHGRRLLFTGDIGPSPERRLLAAGGASLESAVLKVPHHGSDGSNAAFFLAAIRPEVAVFSAGRKNRYRHPGPATVEELERLGARILLTARHGALTYARCRISEAWKTHLYPPGEEVRRRNNVN